MASSTTEFLILSRQYLTTLYMKHFSGYSCRVKTFSFISGDRNLLPDHVQRQYRLEFIRAYIDFPVNFTSSTHLKVFCTMGDRLAMSLATIVIPSAGISQIVRSKCLYALKCAFRNPEMIEHPEDRIPSVARWVLEFLSMTCGSADEAATIDEVRQMLRQSDEYDSDKAMT